MNNSMQQQSQYNIERTFNEEQLFSDLDPMLEGGLFKVAFNRQCAFELRQVDSEGKQYGSRDMLGVRIMANFANETCTQVKIQITSEADLYMIYECKVNQKKFQRLKKMQALNFNFANFLPMLIKQLSLRDKYPDQYTVVLYINKHAPHNLTIVQNIQYKSIELLSLEFEPLDLELKKQCLSYRFSLLKTKNQRIQNKTKQMLSLVKLKNPNLLQSMVKRQNTTGMQNTMMLSRYNKTTYR